jgi:hypothetical protein
MGYRQISERIFDLLTRLTSEGMDYSEMSRKLLAPREMVRIKKWRTALSSRLRSAHPKGMWQKKRVVFALCTLIFVWHEDD